MRTYIAGAITNEPNYQTLFTQAAAEVREIGLEPVLPTELPHEHDKSWIAYMRECLACLVYCEAIYLLTNWSQSDGAKIEADIAQKLGLKIIYQ